MRRKFEHAILYYYHFGKLDADWMDHCGPRMTSSGPMRNLFRESTADCQKGELVSLGSSVIPYSSTNSNNFPTRSSSLSPLDLDRTLPVSCTRKSQRSPGSDPRLTHNMLAATPHQYDSVDQTKVVMNRYLTVCVGRTGSTADLLDGHFRMKNSYSQTFWLWLYAVLLPVPAPV